ncbi:MAG TPA: ISKra4 family transposase [Polyangiaceae bacterium]|nr:ISKra4 family transposase [Polyangiaceae bacterium]
MGCGFPAWRVRTECKQPNGPPQSLETTTMEAHSIPEQKPFSAADAKFRELVERLGSEEILAREHGEVEELLRVEGREVLRMLMQDHLALRSPAKAIGGEVEGSDGQLRQFERRGMKRPLTTIFGTVTVERTGYRGREGGALIPLDAVLNVPSDKYSHGVRARAAALVAKTSFEDAAATLSHDAGAPVPKRQVESMGRALAVDFDTYYEERCATSVGDEASLLVLGFDGTGVHMRPEALREQTRKLREAMPDEDPWPSPKAAGPKRTNGTRSATVSVCYEVEPYPRTFQDILRDLRGLKATEDQQPRRRPKPQAKRVAASLKKSVRQVVREGFEDAQRRDPQHEKRWVVLLDGNEHQLEAVLRQARATDVEITIIIDLIHVAGYLWAAAKVLRPDDFSERRQWVMEKLTEILWGNTSTAAAAMRRSATMKKLGTTERKPVDDCAAYLLKYKPYLRYDEALAAGLPITTSVVEGTCHHLVKDRMAITGARWGLEGGESVLRLRALRLNGDLDDYLQFHRRQELHRNHLSRYANAKVPELQIPGPGLRLVT